MYLKATRITRKIDELGRIVIPKEIRRNLGIRDGETLEIFTEDEAILLKKHSIMQNFEELGTKLCNIISSILSVDIIITDREKIIATSKESTYLNCTLSKELMSLIDNRETNLSEEKRKIILEDQTIEGYFSICPIISSIDSLGLIIIISEKQEDYIYLAKVLSKIMSDKLDIY